MLKSLLQLEPLPKSVFVARHHQENFRNTLFGGQVLAQGLMAAGLTTPRPVHSLHAYFLRPGKFPAPIQYHVENLRDGRTVSTRKVSAIQDGEEIFCLLCSFHELEDGYEHQPAFPEDLPRPKQLLSALDQSQRNKLLQASETLGTAPIEFLPCQNDVFRTSKSQTNNAFFWMRSHEELGEDPLTNACALAFASDIGLLACTLLPHDTSLFSGDVQPASMDHAIWFHQPCHFSQWHLYKTESPWAGKSRGLGHGSIFNEQGVLVASTAQEGLIRPIRST